MREFNNKIARIKTIMNMIKLNNEEVDELKTLIVKATNSKKEKGTAFN